MILFALNLLEFLGRNDVRLIALPESQPKD